MQFLSPQFLFLIGLSVVPIALYLFRRKTRTFDVSTLVFFKTLALEHQESAWLRRLKKLISLILTLLMLILPVFVLSRLLPNQDDSENLRSIVILLDRSASMGVKNDSGESRLDEAKRRIRARLERVPEEVGVSLVAYDARPEVIQPRTLSRRELISRLDALRVQSIAARPEEGLETASLLAGLERPSAIWHASDRLFGDELSDSEWSFQELNVAMPEVSNPGIIGFQLRPAPLQHAVYEAYVQVALNEAAIEEATVRVEISVGGVPNQYRDVDLSPGDRVGLSFRVNGVSRQILKVELQSEFDRFLLDNEIVVPLPEVRPILAAWIRPDEMEDPYTRLALAAIQESGRFELLKGSPEAWPLSEEVDAIIFDGWLPEEWPQTIPAIVINPPASSGPIISKRLSSPIPFDEIRVGNAKHPLLYRISTGRIALTQTVLFETTNTLEPLWFAGDETILAAGEVKGQRLILMGFSPGLSERLPLTASFPLLIGNALLWCVEETSERVMPPVYASGDLVEVEGNSVNWLEARSAGLRNRKIPLNSDVLIMDRPGYWETDSGQKGASFLLSPSETNLSVKNSIANEMSFGEERTGTASLKSLLLVTLLIILFAEYWLLHRFAVY
tara:strand:+ start:6479 stop:8332 length:1854 start_codon:yes stop_codon:yes gene_type:complete